jgi:hypothetical protein
MESYLTYAGFVGSAISTLATLYFWLVRMRQERPCLKPYLVDKEFFLGQGRDDLRQIGVKAGIIVANYSVLPNAILGARLWVRLREGWHEVEQLAFDKQTPQPFNLPPLQTVLLRLTGALSFPYQDALEEGSKTTANYLNAFVMQPLEMKLELRHLNERVNAHVLTMQADRQGSAPRAPSLSSAA